MEIYGKSTSDELIEEIVSDVKKKRELARISSDSVKKELIKFLKHNSKILNYFALIDAQKMNLKQIKKSSEYKKTIKNVRQVLWRCYGMFIEDIKKRERLLDEIKSLKNKKAHLKILSTQKSTKERIPIYSKIYKKIFEVTGKPKSILDLGCGMNPFSYPFIKEAIGNDCKYYASDISEEDCNFIQRYFKKMHIKGITFPLDLREIKEANILDIFPKTDVCFLFKVLETIEKGRHKIAEMIINAVNSEYVVASFPTKTISGARMLHPYRGWVERMCKRLDYEYTILTFENEIFYVIRKRFDFLKLFDK